MSRVGAPEPLQGNAALVDGILAAQEQSGSNRTEQTKAQMVRTIGILPRLSLTEAWGCLGDCVIKSVHHKSVLLGDGGIGRKIDQQKSDPVEEPDEGNF